MKVLQINKYHYLKGGADKVYLDTSNLLAERGHEVLHFSTSDTKNEFSLTSEFFVKSPDFLTLSTWQKMKSSLSYIYSNQSKQNLTNLILEHQPDLAHIHIFFGELSLSILSVLRKFNIPVVMTLHDFKLLCPIYSLYDQDNSICEKCASGNILHCVRKKCNKNNYAYSLMASVESVTRDWLFSYEKYIDHFIAVSKFSMKKHLEYRVQLEGKISHLYNFVDRPLSVMKPGHEDYYCYFGRLSREKGLLNLVNAFAKNGFKLKIAGEGPFKKELEQYCQQNSISNVAFVGHQSGLQLERFVNRAKFTIVPSECYESFGLVVIESMQQGTPVIASNIGAIPELVEHHRTGFLFTSGQLEAIQQAIMLADSYNTEAYQALSQNCIQFANKFNSQNHYKSLMRIYDKVVPKNR